MTHHSRGLGLPGVVPGCSGQGSHVAILRLRFIPAEVNCQRAMPVRLGPCLAVSDPLAACRPSMEATSKTRSSAACRSAPLGDELERATYGGAAARGTRRGGGGGHWAPW